MSPSIPRTVPTRSARRPSLLPGAVAMALATLACSPTTRAADEATDDDAQLVVEAYIVEVERPIFDTGYDAVAAAARGEASALLPGVSGATLAERLEQAEQSGAVAILAAPSLVVRSSQSASVQSGLQIPVQTVTSEAVTVQFVNATLRFEVSPRLRRDGRIALEIEAQKRFPESVAVLEDIPSSPIQTTEMRTTLIVADGGTAVVGGVFETRAAAQTDGAQARGNELVVLVTPRLLDL